MERAEELVERLVLGESIAIVSDAGTPGISDPGFRIVRRAIEVGADVVPVPGPAAFVSAAIASGMPTDSIFYAGFLPAKKGERRRRLEEVRGIPATLVFYEAPHRLAKSLADCAEILGDRNAAIARELTKMHEEIIRGTLAELAATFKDAKPKGEIVIVIERCPPPQKRSAEAGMVAEKVAELIAEGRDRKEALKAAAKEFGISKSEAYRFLLQAEDPPLEPDSKL